jgi:hypothetical protein
VDSRSTAPDSDAAPPSSPLTPGDVRERLEAAEREIEGAFFKLLEWRAAAAGARAIPAKTTLNLSIEVSSPSGREPGSAPSSQLFRQLQRAADRHAGKSAPFPPGKVYCHWCRSFTCEHSSPAEARSVFGGYSATGQPRWPEFVSVLLEKRHPRVDTIFRDGTAPITLVQWGHELSSEQLPIYGKGSPIYRIIGQVALGYLFHPEAAGPGARRAPLALTLQVVESTDNGASFILNILGRLPDGTPAFQAIEESSDSRFASALSTARRGLDEIALVRLSRRRRHAERCRRVHGVLQHLARSIERIHRQRERRTRHSEDRHLHRGRPASTALKDALHAAPGAIYRDIEERTWVVIGPKNRVHVFNDEALHVTSVVYPGETVRQRTTRGKWRAAPTDEMSAFREALRRRSSGM